MATDQRMTAAEATAVIGEATLAQGKLAKLCEIMNGSRDPDAAFKKVTEAMNDLHGIIARLNAARIRPPKT